MTSKLMSCATQNTWPYRIRMELIAESEDLEDETDKELECEVVCDDVDSDYVYTRFVTYFLCRLQTFSLKDGRMGGLACSNNSTCPSLGFGNTQY